MPDQHKRDLGPADLEILEFERARWKHEGTKITTILERFGYTHTRYLQRLNAIIDHPQAAAYNAALVRQLQGVRSKRIGQRSALRRGIDVG